jgi:hypothetical protein
LGGVDIAAPGTACQHGSASLTQACISDFRGCGPGGGQAECSRLILFAYPLTAWAVSLATAGGRWQRCGRSRWQRCGRSPWQLCGRSPWQRRAVSVQAAYIGSLVTRVFVTVKLADAGGSGAGFFGSRQWTQMFQYVLRQNHFGLWPCMFCCRGWWMLEAPSSTWFGAVSPCYHCGTLLAAARGY